MLNEPCLHQEMVPAEVYMQRAAASFALKINNPSELKVSLLCMAGKEPILVI